MSKVSHLELLSACIDAAEQCSVVICDVLERGTYKSYTNKSGDESDLDPQTEADLGAQHVIQIGLQSAFPGIAIVGEEPEDAILAYLEQKQKKGLTVQKTVTLRKDLFTPSSPDFRFASTRSPLNLHHVPTELTQLDLKDILIYIDPLDGTREFTAGHAEHVTTLISITYQGYSLGGVIYYPTLKKGVYGGIGFGCYPIGTLSLTPQRYSQYQVIKKHPHFSKLCAKWILSMEELMQSSQDQTEFTFPIPESTKVAFESIPNKVTTTQSRFSPALVTYFNKINIDPETQLLRAGGAGNKGVQVLTGICRAYVYPAAGPKRWDIGCLDGLLYAHGGMLSDIHGDLYHYNRTDLVVAKGTICSLTDHHLYCIKKEEIVPSFL